MATPEVKPEQVQPMGLTSQKPDEQKKKGFGLKLKTQDPKNESKPSTAEYKRTHSYPEDKKSIIKKTKQKSHGSHPEMLQRLQSQQAMTVAVFLVEKAARLLNLEDGKNATAGTMKRMMMENLGLKPDAKEVFCIWLKSPLLQLQLKDHHIPYKLRKVWPELLKKFTNANDEAIEIDEPILCYQRNSFYPLSEEKKITDAKLIRRLFEEAKFNVLSGAYPLNKKESLVLGGILACIENGKFNPEHKIGFFKDRLTEFLPVSACKVGWSLPGRRSATRNTLEQQLLDKYQEVSNKGLEVKQLYWSYLEECWHFPYYGSVFFVGQIEKPTSIISSIIGSSDLPVRVGVNREKLHVIDETRNEILLCLGFDELSWDYTPANEDDKDCLDTFWLEFDSKEGDGTTTVQRLQIFSKQAVMIDALVQSCVECEDNIHEEPQCQNIGGEIRCRIDRLSLSKLESSLARKKKTNVSFSNPFSRPKRFLSQTEDQPKKEKS